MDGYIAFAAAASIVGGLAWAYFTDEPAPEQEVMVEATRSASSAELEALMRHAVTLLHQHDEPIAAADILRRVLAAMPSHYGAQYQLAAALERSGQSEAALEAWSRFLVTARAYGSDVDIAQAAQRIAMLRSLLHGIEALEVRDDADAAAHAFRIALRSHPGHFGAQYQLARALDAAGDTEEATKAWLAVLTAAKRLGDDAIADAARARIVALQGAGSADR